MNKGKDLSIECVFLKGIIKWVLLMMLRETLVKKMVVSEQDQERQVQIILITRSMLEITTGRIKETQEI
jgi:hypothetical protein